MQKKRWGQLGVASAVLLSMSMMTACGSSTQTSNSADGSNKNPIKIGVVTSKTGPLEGYGNQELNGLKLGIEYATGGTNKVNGRDVQLLIEDDGGKPDEGIKQARKLFEEDNIDILQGTASSAVAAALEPLAQEYKKVFMIDPAAADDLTGKGFNKYVFRTGRNSSQDSLTGGKYTVENLGKNVVELAPDSLFGKSSDAAWKASIEKYGGKVSQEILAPQDTKDFSPYLQKAVASHADVLLISWAGDGGAALFKQIAELKVADKMKITTGIPDIAGIKAMGDSAAGLQGMTAYYYGLPKNKENDWLVEHHQKEFNAPPDLFTAGGFTAGIAIVEGIKKANSTDAEKLIPALEGMTVHGAKGDYTFRKEDHQAIQPMYIVKLEKQAGVDHLVPTLIKEMTPEETAPPITVGK